MPRTYQQDVPRIKHTPTWQEPNGLLCNECVRAGQLYLDHSDEFISNEQQILFEEGKPAAEIS